VGTLVPAAIRRSPAAFALAVAAYIGAALALEPYGGRAGELLIGVVTWIVLVAATKPLSSRDRGRVAAVVLVASAGEVLGSIVLGLYSYRRGGIPAFVPPGHGLVYLAGYRLAQSRFVRAHGRAVVRAAIAGGAAWAVLALALPHRPDAVGAIAMVALVAFLIRGREPALFACMLLAVALLELYGTRMGTWAWAHHWPGLPLPMGNPPSGAAAGYVAFDALALRLGPILERLVNSPAARPELWSNSNCGRSAARAT
jgi:hypothetical protein